MTPENDAKTKQGVSGMLEVGVCISGPVAQAAGLHYRNVTCRQKLLGRKWMWTSNPIHKWAWMLSETLSWLLHISDSLTIAFNRATWAVCKWVNQCQRFPQRLKRNWDLGTFLFKLFFFLVNACLVSASGLCVPRKKKKHYNLCTCLIQPCTVISSVFLSCTCGGKDLISLNHKSGP